MTIPEITKRLRKLPADKLSVVYDFVSYLAEREAKLPPQLAGRRVTRLLDQVYARESSAIDPMLARMQAATLEREAW